MFRIDNKNGRIYYDNEKMIEHLANIKVYQLNTFFTSLRTDNFTSRIKFYYDINDNIKEIKILLSNNLESENIMVILNYKKIDSPLNIKFNKLNKISLNEFEESKNKAFLTNLVMKIVDDNIDIEMKNFEEQKIEEQKLKEENETNNVD